MSVVMKVLACVSSELFSAPRLTLAPSEVFQEEPMTLTCRSERFAPERLRREDLTYSLVSVGHLLQPGANGVFVGKSLSHDFNYTCEARAKGLSKSSPVLTVRPKGKDGREDAGPPPAPLPVSRWPRSHGPTSPSSSSSVVPVAASVPRIWVKGRAILGRPVRILCQSDSGSPPINYTLLRGWEPVDTVSVQLPSQQAEFTVGVSSSAELSRLTCEARNNPRKAPRSPGLDALVVGKCPTVPPGPEIPPRSSRPAGSAVRAEESSTCRPTAAGPSRTWELLLEDQEDRAAKGWSPAD